MQATVLAVVGIGITAAVYGGVALIVKADDLGVALARNGLDSIVGRTIRAFGRGLVLSMPVFLSVLAIVGTAAMIWVGGGIIVHGLETYGFSWLAHSIHSVAVAIAHAAPLANGFVEWLAGAAGSGLVRAGHRRAADSARWLGHCARVEMDQGGREGRLTR